MAMLEATGEHRGEGSGAASVERFLVSMVPHPVTVAFILTLLVALISLTANFEAVVKGWGAGFISLYPFVMENLLILLFGYALGMTPIIRGTIGRLAGSLNSLGAAIVAIAGLSIVLTFLNWGVGILGGTFLARETARRAESRGMKLDYPILLAAGLSGMVVWESGLSGIVPLYLVEKNHFLIKITGQIGIGATIFSPLNLIVAVTLLIAVPLALYLARPATASPHKPRPEEVPTPNPTQNEKSMAAWMERSRTISLFFGGIALLYVIRFLASGKPLDTPNLLFTLMALGIFLRVTPMDYQRDVIYGFRVIWFIALPLMFYTAMQGMMNASGLIAMVTQWLSTISAPALPAVTFVIATVANFFVPTAGGQLILGGPSVMEAAKVVGASYSKVALALAYGAGLAKLIQLYIFAGAIGLGEGEIKMGSLARYAGIVFAVAFVVCLIGLVVLPG